MNKRLLIIFTFSLVLLACKKDDTIPNNGIYRGVFRVFASSGDTLADGAFNLALFESDQHFVMEGDTSTNLPASHAGTFVVDGATTMIFTNTSGSSVLYPTDAYLDGTFNYVFDDVNFVLTRTVGTKNYEYDMVRN